MNANDKNNTKRTDPITIPTRGRHRSMSISSLSSSSASSSENPITPDRISIPSPSNSPILSHFLTNSPSKSPTTATAFSFRKFGTSPVFDEEMEKEPPVAAHARRASSTIASRFTLASSSYTMDAQGERATNLLRRLSLGGPAFQKPLPGEPDPRSTSPPSPPPNSATNPSPGPPLINKPRRSATLSVAGSRPRRAPSPMGERILKGHFDGFN